jgi:hypothetical protein
MQISIFWDMKPCSPAKAFCLIHTSFLLDLLFNPEDGGVMLLRNIRDFGIKYTESSRITNNNPFKALTCCLLHVGFFLDLLFNPEDGGDISPEMLVDFQRIAVCFISSALYSAFKNRLGYTRT